MIKEKNIGSSLEDFLKEEITKSEMARKMKTSRSQLDRLLDPDNQRIQLDTMMKAAAAVGKQVRIDLVDLPLST